MRNPSNTPSNTVHHCNNPGVSTPDTVNWEIGPSESLASAIAYEAVNRVLFPMRHTQFQLDKTIHSFLDEHLDRDAWDRYQRLYAVMSDLTTAIEAKATIIAAEVTAYLPARWVSLEDMLQTGLDGAGLCCPVAVDQMACDALGWRTREDLAGAGMDPSWLTLAGAEAHRETDAGRA